MEKHRRLISLSIKSGGLFALVVIAGLLASGLVVLQSWLLSRVINGAFLERAQLADLRLLLQMILLVIFARALFTFFNGWLSGKLAERIKQELRRALLAKIDRLGPLWLRQQKTGEVASTVLQGVDALDAYFGQFLPQVILAAVLPLVILLVVFPMDLLTGIVFVVTAPLIPLFMVLIGKMSDAVTRRQWLGLQRMGDFLLDSIRGLKTLLLLGRSRDRLAQIRRVSEDYRTVTLNVLKVTFLSAFTLEMIATIATAVVAVEIGLRLLYGWIDFQHAFFILLLAPEFYLPLRNLSMRYHAAMTGVTAAVSIYAVLDAPEPPKLVVSLPQVQPDFAVQELRLQEVAYRYENSSRVALQEVSFTFQPGKRYALVGENGAGKSTVFSLLLRFAQPSAGMIAVGGQDYLTWEPQDWRKAISWVSQKPSIFNASLLENVRLFEETYSEQQVIRVLEQARLGHLLNTLPNGLQTPLLEMGERLSSGERQRLAIARAFLKDGSLLLLDEPTSYLDVQASREFYTALDELMHNRTTLLIAHHLPVMKLVDELLVLRGGRLVQSGSFDRLARSKGYFADLLKAGEA
jgi:ATP-binding cassette subfamily C protein CydD